MTYFSVCSPHLTLWFTQITAQLKITLCRLRRVLLEAYAPDTCQNLVSIAYKRAKSEILERLYVVLKVFSQIRAAENTKHLILKLLGKWMEKRAISSAYIQQLSRECFEWCLFDQEVWPTWGLRHSLSMLPHRPSSSRLLKSPLVLGRLH